MEFLAPLWLPVVVSAVLVFFLSAASHMLIPFRRAEWRHLPGQAALQGALRGVAPGLYGFPLPADERERGRPEALRAFAEGPSGWLAVVPPGPMSMGRNLGLSLLLNLVVSALVGYLAYHALGPAPARYTVIRIVSTAGFLAYAVGAPYEGIWFWRPWRSFAMTVLEALAYGLAMGAVFAWLWPR